MSIKSKLINNNEFLAIISNDIKDKKKEVLQEHLFE